MKPSFCSIAQKQIEHQLSAIWERLNECERVQAGQSKVKVLSPLPRQTSWQVWYHDNGFWYRAIDGDYDTRDRAEYASQPIRLKCADVRIVRVEVGP